MAVDNSLQSLLATLTASIESATDALPKEDIVPPKDGISLLDVKNELFLSYLQNLVFLILLRLRSRTQKTADHAENLSPQDDVVKKLVELRLYLERGVRPLENRLKYQVDKILRTADEAARRPAPVAKKAQRSKLTVGGQSNSDTSDAESADTAQTDDEIDEMSYGPIRAAFVRPKDSAEKQSSVRGKDGIYKPPKITPVSMPTTEGRDEPRARRPEKSAVLDEFVATELSSAPIAQPSIGSTIVDGGRRVKSDRERKEDAERREFEESHFVRLQQTKKEKAQQRQRQRGGFGGEEWRQLGAGLDRIERLTQKKSGSLGSLAKSRKRPVEDGPRGSGLAAGDAFEKRRKVVTRYRR